MPNNPSPDDCAASGHDTTRPRSHEGGAVTEAEVEAAERGYAAYMGSHHPSRDPAPTHTGCLRAALEAAAAVRQEALLETIRHAWGSWAEDKTELFEDWLFSDKPIREATLKLASDK